MGARRRRRAGCAKGQEGYAQALERLNRAVDDFNRDMSAPAASLPAAQQAKNKRPTSAQVNAQVKSSS